MIETASGLIGFVDTLDSLGEILTDERQQCKIFELAGEFGGWRRCKGDGNCFYRASGFALIEAALCGGDPQSLRPLTERFQEAAGGEAKDLIALMYELPEAGVTAIELWYQALLCNADLDAQLVRSVRQVCAGWLRDNRHRKFRGMEISKWTKSSRDLDLDDFVQQEVLVNGREAEHLEIHATTQALGSKLEIIQVDRSEGPAQRYMMPDEAPGGVKATLLFRPGHYDIFYRWALFEEVTRLQDDLQLRRACSQQAVSGAMRGGGSPGFNPSPFPGQYDSSPSHRAEDDNEEEVYTPFPKRSLSMCSQDTKAANCASGRRTDTRSGSMEEGVGTLRRTLDESLVSCVACINSEKDTLASRLRHLDKEKAALRDLRAEVKSLRSAVDRESEELRAQQESLSRAQAETKAQAGWWACCLCPGAQPPSLA